MSSTDAKTQEALDILQEECAEVIVEVSKCRRFGIDSIHHKTNIIHKEMLEQEIGDVLALVNILVEQGLLDQSKLDAAISNKIEKLKSWSSLFN